MEIEVVRLIKRKEKSNTIFELETLHPRQIHRSIDKAKTEID
jgi:hypothetical protein